MKNKIYNLVFDGFHALLYGTLLVLLNVLFIEWSIKNGESFPEFWQGVLLILCISSPLITFLLFGLTISPILNFLDDE